jgi:UDP-glucose 4-epimerase
MTKNTQTILVAGGAGYIGSHVCVELLEQGYEVVVMDNLVNSSAESLQRVQHITGRELRFAQTDMCDESAVNELLRETSPDAVIHFAALKAVGESVEQPLRYYQNNVVGSATLFKAMAEQGVTRLVFSSTATVYGDPSSNPIDESFPLAPTNPYGRGKQMIEDILRDLCAAQAEWHVSLLRYFNPVGAHPSGLIGEDPHGLPNNLMPYIAQTASGMRTELSVYGNDYDTRDGTGVRDYIHVVDLARGHLKALEKLSGQPGCSTYNLGTGRGYSVLEMIDSFEKASEQKIPYRIVDRRPGDIATCYADASLAQRELGWSAELDINAMCEDSWNWQRQNPRGYEQ